MSDVPQVIASLALAPPGFGSSMAMAAAGALIVFAVIAYLHGLLGYPVFG